MTAARNHFAIGIDVGGTKVLAGAVRSDGELIAEAWVASPSAPEQLTPALREVTALILDELNGAGGAVLGIGLALPGLVDRGGILHATPNLGASERGLDLLAEFGGELLVEIDRTGQHETEKIALAFDNDANCAAIGEFTCGAARATQDAVVVSLGTGIGGGIFADGRLLRGAHSFAGEIGHTIVDPNGEPCPCGRRGCWERYASGTGLANLARRSVTNGRSSTRLLQLAGSLDALQGEHVTAAAREGDDLARSIIAEFADWLALGFSNIVELFDPELIVIGGGLVREADLFLEQTRAAFERSCRPTQGRHGGDLVLANLGEHAACIGAGLLSLAATS